MLICDSYANCIHVSPTCVKHENFDKHLDLNPVAYSTTPLVVNGINHFTCVQSFKPLDSKDPIVYATGTDKIIIS